jgi:hypothetical protein
MDDAEAIMRQPLDDVTAMRRAVYDLQQLDPAMSIAVLTAVLSECAVAHGFKLVTIAEQLVLCGADFHDEWSKPLDALDPEEVARLMMPAAPAGRAERPTQVAAQPGRREQER